MIKKKGLVISRQIGTARAIKAWMDEPKTGSSFELDIFTFPPGQSILPGTVIHSFFTPTKKYDFLLSGTSLSSQEDSLFFSWARDNHLPSIAFVDQWINYRERFEEQSLPDYIFLIDDRARADLVRELNPASHLVVAGSPALHFAESFWLSHQRNQNSNLIYFATEPCTKEYVDKHGLYDVEQLNYLIQLLEKFPQHELRVLLHPADSTERLGAFARFLTNETKEQVFERAGMIAGMRSMILLEASLLGIPAVSLQIGRKTVSSLTDNRPGISVVTELENFNFPAGEFHPDKSLYRNSWTEKILNLL